MKKPIRLLGRMLCCLGAVLVFAQAGLAQYAAHQNGDVVELVDSRHDTTVSIAPSFGDMVFSMKVKGQDVLFLPTPTFEEYKKHPSLAGIPFLAPWANRLDEQAFYANGKKYPFDMSLGNVRGANPMHGFLSHAAGWEVVELKATKNAAWLTCRLDFYKHPDWMAQFPFAHTIEITQRLQNGVLEVHTKIVNLSTDPMPVSIGFHPYYQLTDSKRDEWTVSVGARKQWLLTPSKIPTGETQPITDFFPNPQKIALKDYDLDNVFGDLIRDSQGRATLSVTGKKQKIEVQFGPKFLAAVIYAPNPKPGTPAATRGPQNRNFICFEPMVGITDALNLAQKGLYKDLQSIAPGGSWEESFWVKPSGF